MHGYRCIGERGARNVSHAVHVTFVRVDRATAVDERGASYRKCTSELISLVMLPQGHGTFRASGWSREGSARQNIRRRWGRAKGGDWVCGFTVG